MPEQLPDDPITTSSLSNAVLISIFLLMVTVAWSLWAEFFGLRPWRTYQRDFGESYSSYLRKQVSARKKAEEAVYSSSEYKQLKSDADSLTARAKPKDEEIEEQIALLDEQRAAITPAFQLSRGLVGSRTFEYEVVPPADKDKKESRRKDLEDARKSTYEVDWPRGGGEVEKGKKFTADELLIEFSGIMSNRAQLVAQRGEIDKPAKDASAKLAAFLDEKLPGLASSTLEVLLQSAENMDIHIRQINVNPSGALINYVGGAGLVDRCQSCHVGTDSTLVPTVMTLTKADLGLAKSKDAPFTSHPDPELLALHPLEKFGCSPCHGGNGRALDSVERGHGRYEHWLWPLYYPENFEAGCQTCHAADAWTEHAPMLNEGRQLFRNKGCIGCHRYQGFDNQDEELVNSRQEIAQLEKQKADGALEIPRLQKLGDNAPDNAAAQRYYTEATNLTVTMSGLDSQIETLDTRSHNLLQEIKKVGPDLKEVRMKIQPDWIPYWLQHTHEYRPTTKMPQFHSSGLDHLSDDEAHAIAAFIWQQGITGPALPKQAPGNAAHGKELLESRGCLACHSVGEDSNLIGGTFAANLSRVGEKDNYEYLVRWIHNPRERTRPYCPFEKRDLGPEDYAKHGLPYVFDLDHSRCPNDGHELVVEQPTVMPSLRLSPDDARDVASYLITLKHPDAQYTSAASYMNDPQLAGKGRVLVQHYGCAGCHEISGLEDETRIGTELTNEGSKPIERLDFALWTTDAKRGLLPDGKDSPRGKWYDAKGFFENKLSNPGLFDQGKYHADPMEALRMPKPNIQSKEELDSLVTFLLGSVDPTLPPDYMYKPADRRKYIQEGWWIVTKYNCIGCHQIDIGQKSVMMGLPFYQGDAKANLPPVLTSEGARVNPEWLKRFLANPSLSTTDTNRNGVRSYLQVRMPTFYLSNDEIRKIVLFFEALSDQPEPYIAPKIAPLTAAEEGMARSIFTSPAAPCLKCHMTGNAAHDKNASAPNFLLAPDRLRPAWTARWITDPAKIIPGTAMPSGLFHRENDRWVFSGPLPPALKNFTGDNADLLVRYMLTLTPQEQGALVGRTPAGKPAGSGGGQ
ncbi:MAG: hypothetical protein ACRD50_14425 [Candidatus Acidiferrales bacterium]